MLNSDRRHTSSLLKDLRNRLINLCREKGRDDLVDAVFILWGLAGTNPNGVPWERNKMRSVLAKDDDLLNMEKQQREHYHLVSQACAERRAGAVLH